MEHQPSRHPIQVTSLLLLVLGLVSAVYYVQFLLNPANRGDLLPYTLLLIAEGLSIFQTIGSWWTIVVGTGSQPQDHRFDLQQRHLFEIPADEFPTIDVFITVYGEPLETVRATVAAARDMHLPHYTYILDDGRSPEVAFLAEELQVAYITRHTNQGAKAGNINHALNLTSSEYIGIFDADHIPKKEFLLNTLPFFWNRNLAFVQTPQFFDNLHNFISIGSAEAQRLFYRLVCPGKNRFNAVFWVGTNVLFSRRALLDVGGVYEESHSEDIWTAYRLHKRGWESIFIPTILAVGQAPATVETYLKQQLRWATGSFEMFFKDNPLFSKSKLTTDQKLQYFWTSTFYFNGLAIFILLLLPLLFLYMGLMPVHSSLGGLDWLRHWLPFFILQIAIVYNIEGRWRWQTAALSMATFPVYLKALTNVLRGKKTAWFVTNQAKSTGDSTGMIWTQLTILIFSLFGLPLALLTTRDLLTSVLCVAWVLLNIFFMANLLVHALPKRQRIRKQINHVVPSITSFKQESL